MLLTSFYPPLCWATLRQPWNQEKVKVASGITLVQPGKHEKLTAENFLDNSEKRMELFWTDAGSGFSTDNWEVFQFNPWKRRKILKFSLDVAINWNDFAQLIKGCSIWFSELLRKFVLFISCFPDSQNRIFSEIIASWIREIIDKKMHFHFPEIVHGVFPLPFELWKLRI